MVGWMGGMRACGVMVCGVRFGGLFLLVAGYMHGRGFWCVVRRVMVGAARWQPGCSAGVTWVREE